MLTGAQEDITYHHIEKACYGGPKTFENGALLSSIAQRWLHCRLEKDDPRTYDLVNDCLQLYKAAFMQEEWELVQQWENEIIPLAFDNITEYCKDVKVKKKVRRRTK